MHVKQAQSNFQTEAIAKWENKLHILHLITTINHFEKWERF